MVLKRFLKASKTNLLDISSRIKNKDFKGYTGLAIKNSLYQTTTNLITKLGSLLFTIILARLLIPEVFGLYSLALSTILFFVGFSELGIGPTLIRFMSKNKKKSKAYIDYLFKLKLIFLFLVSLALLASAYFISEIYYKKPIFLALIAGALYVIAWGLINFFASIYFAENNFKRPFYKEIIFQSIRLILLPIIILLTLNYSSSLRVFYIIIVLSLCHLFSLIFYLIKKPKYPKASLVDSEKKEVINFLLPVSFITISSIFLGYLDMIFLGRFVSSQYIAYYQAALALVGSGIFLSSIGSVFYPIFSRIKGRQLARGFKKAILITALIGIFCIIITYFIAPFLVKLIYGSNYLLSISLLRILSLMFLLEPLISIFSMLYMSKGKNPFLAKITLFIALISLLLNYLLITSFLKYGEYAASLGATIAIIVTKSIYLIFLVFYIKKIDPQMFK